VGEKIFIFTLYLIITQPDCERGVETTRRVVSTGVSNDRWGFLTPHPVIATEG